MRGSTWLLKLEGRPGLLKTLRILTASLFPVVLVLAVEGVNAPSVGTLARFITASPGAFLFDILLLGTLFAALLLLLRRAWLAALLESALFYVLALVEYYKFDANGIHFSITDLVMADKLSDLSGFFDLTPRPGMTAAFFVLTLWILWMAFLRIRVALPYGCSATGGVALLLAGACVVCVPPVSRAVYAACGIDAAVTYAPDGSAHRFEKDRQIAFLTQSVSALVAQRTELRVPPEQTEVEALLPVSVPARETQTPDIVIVMSEAFADFRSFAGLPVPDGVYTNLDALAREGASGTALVPTFGGYTGKTEFELLFGLPVRGIGNTDLPHRLFTDGTPRPTVAAYLRGLGYRTAFVHPFIGSFYNRDKAYCAYGFDDVYFEENFTVDKTTLNGHIDDDALTRQILAALEQSGDVPGFVFAVSMQNHGPYTAREEALPVEDSRLTEAEQRELGQYFYQEQRTDKALGELAQALRARERPAILLFVGDHYPYLGRRSQMYEKFQSGGDKYTRYRQRYVLWSSDGRALTAPQGEISAFYLPYLAMDAGSVAQSRFTAKMNALLQSAPLATFDLGEGSAGWQELMTLTADRTTGAGYSARAGEK